MSQIHPRASGRGIICICLLRRVSILSSNIILSESSFSFEDSEKKKKINFLLLFPALTSMIDSTALTPKTDIFVQSCGFSVIFGIWIDLNIFSCIYNLRDGGIWLPSSLCVCVCVFVLFHYGTVCAQASHTYTHTHPSPGCVHWVTNSWQALGPAAGDGWGQQALVVLRSVIKSIRLHLI